MPTSQESLQQFIINHGMSVAPSAKKKEPRMSILGAKEGFTFGCDPEMFVFDPEGKPVPADMIPGSKDFPHKVEHGAVQRDGMAAEFNIDPVDNFRDFNRNISAVMGQMTAMLPEGFTLKAEPFVVFDPDVFNSAPDDAKELGCSPDHNAWTGEVNMPPAMLDNPYMRAAGGHIHIGWRENGDQTEIQHVLNCRDLVKQLDWYLGGWSVTLSKDPTRRNLYGRAGACRYKPYGVEYRVLDNFWITTRDRRLAVWNRMQQAIASMAQGYLPDRMLSRYSEALQTCINETALTADLQKQCRFPLLTTDTAYARF